MKSRKERSISTLSDDIEPEVDFESSDSRKKARTSRRSSNSSILDMLREDASKANDMMKFFVTNAEQDRLDQRERWDYDRETTAQSRKEDNERLERERVKGDQERTRQYDMRWR